MEFAIGRLPRGDTGRSTEKVNLTDIVRMCIHCCSILGPCYPIPFPSMQRSVRRLLLLRSPVLAVGTALLVSICAFVGAEVRWHPIHTDGTPQHWVSLKLSSIEGGIDLFRLERGSLPPSLSALEPEYIRKLPDDGWGNAFVYRVFPGNTGYLLYSRGRNGIDESGGGDDITTEWKKFTCEQYEEVCWTPGLVIWTTSLAAGLLSVLTLLGIGAISAYRFFRNRCA